MQMFFTVGKFFVSCCYKAIDSFVIKVLNSEKQIY